MKISIKTEQVDNEILVRQFIQRKVKFALDRCGARIKQVSVCLVNQSEDAESNDFLCTIDASFLPSGDIHVSDQGDSPFDAVLQTIQEIQQAISDNLERSRRSLRVGHPDTGQESRSSPEGR